MRPSEARAVRFPYPMRLRTRLIVLCTAVVGIIFAATPAYIGYRLHQARSALEHRDTEEALAQLQAAERVAPGTAETQFLLARAHRRLGRFDKVREHLARAADLGWPTDQLQREQWLALAQAGQLREAEPHLGRLLTDPRGDGPAICEAFVDGYFATYQFGKAFLILDGWQKDHPDDPQPHAFRGLFREHASAWTEALPHYRRALGLAPYRTDIRLRVAQLLMRTQEYEEAARHFERCLVEDPGNPGVLVGWGKCLNRRGEPDAAREQFLRALEHDPRHFDARLAIGQWEQAAGRNKEALKWLKAVCEERPHDTEARYALARVLQAEGRSEDAKEHFQFVAEARDALASLQSLMEQVRRQPDDYDARHRIGAALLQYDDPAHGVAWLRSVLEIRPDHRPAHELLATYYSERGNKELARRHRQAADREDRS